MIQRHFYFMVLLWLLSARAMAFVGGSASLPDFTALVEQTAPGVVYVEAVGKSAPDAMEQVPDFLRRFLDRMPQPDMERETRSSGSGFVIDANGYILTNYHVVDGAESIIVRLNDRSEYKAEIVGTDPATDIALLKVDATGLHALRLGSSAALKPGQWVLAIGAPFNFEHSVTAGIVSAKNRSLPRQPYVPFIQTDVPINRGNSGGPLINLKGEVIGINSQIFSSTGGYMGLSFAIPMDVAMAVASQLREKGEVSRGYLGVGYQEVTRELAENLGLKKPRGALIANVEPDSAADRAGIRVRDVILRYNGQDLVFAADLAPLVGLTPPGSTVEVVIMRDGRRKTLEVTLGELEGDPWVARNSRSGKPEHRSEDLGMVLSDLDEESREEAELDGGVLVRKVLSEKAARAGIQPGDIIIMINNRDIGNLKDLRQALEGQDEDKPVALLIQRNGMRRFVVID